MGISAGVAVLLVALLGGGYLVAGNKAASDRLSAANSALANAGRIDFAAYLRQTAGGFAFSGSGTFDAFGYQRSVVNFVDDVGKADKSLTSEQIQLGAAKARLGDSTWLTALSASSLRHASSRIDYALAANADAKTIVSDFSKDGGFFAAYAKVDVDFNGFITAGNARDNIAIIRSLSDLRTDLRATTPLTNAPGLPTGVHDYLIVIQTFSDDFVKVANNPPSDQAGLTAAEKVFENDLVAIFNYDTSSFDPAIQSFYQPLIAAYDRDFELGAS